MRLLRIKLPQIQVELSMMLKDWSEESIYHYEYSRFSDSTIQYDKKFLPFEIVDRDGKPYI